jgi:hypothetical protein
MLRRLCLSLWVGMHARKKAVSCMCLCVCSVRLSRVPLLSLFCVAALPSCVLPSAIGMSYRRPLQLPWAALSSRLPVCPARGDASDAQTSRPNNSTAQAAQAHRPAAPHMSNAEAVRNKSQQGRDFLPNQGP